MKNKNHEHRFLFSCGRKSGILQTLRNSLLDRLIFSYRFFLETST